ncbi:hypothetical protein [Paractinoplanes brasiliensis]|uniref:Mce-associated membrane protein n=1 Tax=Paractinoplanes brasiliensis TaxID=52695 RepID=A0A4R6JXG8_9ACTN|nr:hypothetical protein [Actinoplanes brasiliensis]TDO41490.1 hypothetical protein C8E87_5223 [Actinoplanes brasiliensis]GID27226.1 hypothetical protein Abr02nite_22090 [Actinoplanes brasiliensis]
MRLSALLAVAVATLGGCAGTSAPPRPSLSSPAPAAAPAPVVENTGTAWPAIVGSLISYGQWLLGDPTPALADVITEPGCAGHDALTDELRSLVSTDAMVRTSPATVTSVSGSAVSRDRAVVEATVSRAAEPVVVKGHSSLSPSAKTIWLEDRAELPATVLTMTLVRSNDRWRFCEIVDKAGDPDGEAITRAL